VLVDVNDKIKKVVDVAHAIILWLLLGRAGKRARSRALEFCLALQGYASGKNHDRALSVVLARLFLAASGASFVKNRS
jgi:hypothetical protein